VKIPIKQTGQQTDQRCGARGRVPGRAEKVENLRLDPFLEGQETRVGQQVRRSRHNIKRVRFNMQGWGRRRREKLLLYLSNAAGFNVRDHKEMKKKEFIKIERKSCQLGDGGSKKRKNTSLLIG